MVFVALAVVGSACNPFGGDDETPTTLPPPTTVPADRVGASVDGVLRIGVLVPLSGALERFGPGMQAAVELAVDEVNDAGGALGKDVEVVVEDSGSTPDQALQAARRLIDARSVDAIVGPASSFELFSAVAAEALDAGRVVCAPTASSPLLTTTDDEGLLFTMSANRAGEATVIADRLAADGRTRVAVVRSDDAEGAAMLDALRRGLDAAAGAGGWTLVAEPTVAVPVGPDDAADAVEAVRGAGPDAIALLLGADEGAAVLAALGAAGLLPAGGAGLSVIAPEALASEDIARAVDPDDPGALHGVSVVRPKIDPEATSAFDARLRARTGLEVVDLAAHAYDCAGVAVLAGAASESDDPASLKGVMLGLKRGGTPCPDVAACLGPVRAGDDVRFEGALGVEWNDAGEPATGVFQRLEFDAAGHLVAVDEVSRSTP